MQTVCQAMFFNKTFNFLFLLTAYIRDDQVLVRCQAEVACMYLGYFPQACHQLVILLILNAAILDK
ncbi:hypothetical protein D3C77_407480 [compost metagenome]